MAFAPTVYTGEMPSYAESVRLDLNIDSTNAAGVYTASVKVPANSVLIDVIIHAVALWNAGTSAALICGDGDDPNGYYDAVDLKANDLLADESLCFAAAGGVEGAYITGTLTHITNRYSTSAKVVTMEITTVGTAPTTGETVMTVVWARNPEGVDGGSKIRLGTYAAS